MTTESDVVVVNFWGNGFGMRVQIALEEKGVTKYEYKEIDLTAIQRSQVVLEMNPVRRSVPILIHQGRPVCESVNILEYIDEMWKGDGVPNLLPHDPTERAFSRFWVHFIDNKGEAKEECKKELIAEFKQLEEVLGDKLYFGGDNFGFLDIAFIPFSSMFYGYETHGNFKFEEECPKLSAWVKRCAARESQEWESSKAHLHINSNNKTLP
ncbi:hypothetical protein RHGRI_036777 [Rhododendron griersonianum]|uniref:glutathione transferase n=1 Tax=Rhododendron griersonianum TaxID=479676 RepID=A0AAV6HPD3_9ERIC|nr:hypothetical protein RHGRI_036777 [Rhododendron griersonianum]